MLNPKAFIFLTILLLVATQDQKIIILKPLSLSLQEKPTITSKECSKACRQCNKTLPVTRCTKCFEPNAEPAYHCLSCKLGYSRNQNRECQENQKKCPRWCLCMGDIPWQCSYCSEPHKTIISNCTACDQRYNLDVQTGFCYNDNTKCRKQCNCKPGTSVCHSCKNSQFNPLRQCLACLPQFPNCDQQSKITKQLYFGFLSQQNPLTIQRRFLEYLHLIYPQFKGGQLKYYGKVDEKDDDSTIYHVMTFQVGDKYYLIDARQYLDTFKVIYYRETPAK